MRRTLGSIVCGLLIACSSSHSPDDGDAAADATRPLPIDATSGMPFDTCEVPSDCVLVPTSCCGSCGTATRGDASAVNRASASAHSAAACGDDGACPPCIAEQDPNLLATCSDAGRCVVIDLLTHPATECESSADCRVRAIECCECGASITPSTVVSISDATAFDALVCDPGAGCPECAPDYPDELGAVCDAGRCVVVLAGAP